MNDPEYESFILSYRQTNVMNPDKNSKIEEILGSLDHCDRVPAPNFFYTRVKAKLESTLVMQKASAKRFFILRPVYALTALAAILIINAVVIFQKGGASTDTSALNDTETLQSIAAEYSLNDNSTVLFDINQEK